MNDDDDAVWQAVRRRLDAVGEDIRVPTVPARWTDTARVRTSPVVWGPRLSSFLATGAIALVLVAVVGGNPLASHMSNGAAAPITSDATPSPRDSLESAAPSQDGRQSLVSLPTWPRPIEDNACPAALLRRVTLRGDPGNAARPVYVESLDGTTKIIIWPHGFSARFSPDLELVNDHGEVVAREGDTLDLGGGVVDPAYDFFACAVSRAD